MHAVKYGTMIYLQKELELLIKMYSQYIFQTFFHLLTMSHFIFNKNAFAHSNPEISPTFPS